MTCKSINVRKYLRDWLILYAVISPLMSVCKLTVCNHIIVVLLRGHLCMVKLSSCILYVFKYWTLCFLSNVWADMLEWVSFTCCDWYLDLHDVNVMKMLCKLLLCGQQKCTQSPCLLIMFHSFDNAWSWNGSASTVNGHLWVCDHRNNTQTDLSLHH